MDWNNICLIAQLLNLTIPSAHLEYNDRSKADARQETGHCDAMTVSKNRQLFRAGNQLPD